jgi:hypothetical protein
MNGTVNFDYQSCLGAIDVHQKATDSVLAAKFGSCQASIAQRLPEVSFGWSRFPPIVSRCRPKL